MSAAVASPNPSPPNALDFGWGNEKRRFRGHARSIYLDIWLPVAIRGGVLQVPPSAILDGDGLDPPFSDSGGGSPWAAEDRDVQPDPVCPTGSIAPPGRLADHGHARPLGRTH
ncbi:hypothetical protein GCM10018952_18970 [Streptosporangium vulgare]